MSSRIKISGDWLAVATLVVLPLVYFFPVTIGQQVFSEGDINWLFLPIRTELARALAEGHLPLWTPGLEAGYPLFAEGEVAALYPLNLILAVLLPAVYAVSYSILFNLIFVSIGMYLFVRSAGLRVASAWLAGFVFAFSGFMLAQTSHVPHLTVAVWLPWLLLFQKKYWQAENEGKKSTGWFLLICVSIGLQLIGGFPQMAFLNIAAYIFFGLFESRLSIKTILLTLVPVIIGIGLAMVQLLPTYELIGLSIRAQESSPAFFTSYSLEPSALMQFISPFSSMGMPDASNMEYWAYVGILPIVLALFAPFLKRDRRTWLVFIFALGVLLLALGGSTPIYESLYYVPIFNRFRVPARFLFLFTFAVAFLAAITFDELQARFQDERRIKKLSIFLVFIPLCGILYLAYTQPIDFWIDVWKILPIGFGSIGVIVLALGILRLIPRPLWQAMVVGLVLIDLTTFAAPFLSSLTRMSPPSELVQASRTVAAMDSTQSIYRVIVDKPPVTAAAIRATLYANLPLIYNKQGVKSYLPSLGLQKNQEYIDQMTLKMRDLMNIRYYLLPIETIGSLPSALDDSEPNGGLSLDLLSTKPKIPPTAATQIELVSYTDQTAKLPNGFLAGELVIGLETGKEITLPIRLGIETADWAFDGFGSLEMQHDKPDQALSFPAYLKSIGRSFDGHKYITRYDLGKTIITSIGVRSFLPSAGLMIDHISLTDNSKQVSLSALLHSADLSLAFRSHAAAMWENLDVMPRAFMVHAAEIINDDQVLPRLKSADLNPSRVILLSDSATPITQQNSSRDRVSITQYRSERVALDVVSDAPGYLVLTDSWYPGWQVWVDGQPAPNYRADYIFRAVPLQSGSHSVVFEYHPQSFTWGAVISLATLGLCLGIAMVDYRRKN